MVVFSASLRRGSGRCTGKWGDRGEGKRRAQPVRVDSIPIIPHGGTINLGDLVLLPVGKVWLSYPGGGAGCP